MKPLSIFILIGLLFGLNVFAQNSFQDVANMSDKNFAKMLYMWPAGKGMPDGSGISPYLVDKEIKKVALIAYTMVAGESYDKFSKVAKGFTEEGIKYFSNKIYDNTISSIKEAFAKEGIEVITYDELTDAQKKIFNATQGTNWTDGKKFTDWGEKQLATGESAYQYKHWELQRGVEIPWVDEPIADFAKSLGVDAALLISNGLNFEGSTLMYGSMMITMLGENPVPLEEGKKRPFGSEALYYGQGQIILDKKVEVANIKKNSVSGENYEGLGKIYERLIGYMMIDINGRKNDPDFKFNKWLKDNL